MKERLRTCALNSYRAECIFRASPRIMQLNTKEVGIKKNFERCCIRGKVERKNKNSLSRKSFITKILSR